MTDQSELLEALKRDLAYLDHGDDDPFICSQCSRNRTILTALLVKSLKQEGSRHSREGLIAFFARIPEFTCSYKHTQYSALHGCLKKILNLS